MTAQTVWIGIGFLGQALFSARFVIQWLASERSRRSVVPHAFWWFALAGGVTLFSLRCGGVILSSSRAKAWVWLSICAT